MTNARTFSDGTIELCTKAFRYTYSDQSSIIWHEIYHINNEHSMEKEYKACPPFVLTVTEDIQPYFEILLKNEFDGFGTIEDYAREMLLEVNSTSSIEWYENEIETYKAELNNGIERSPEYEAELNFQLWKYEEICNHLKGQ